MRAKTNDIGGGGMSYIRGESREQIYLLPEAIDDYVRADNPVRFLDAFVEQLDLEGTHTAFIMGIDGTWRRQCKLDDVSATGAKLTVEGSIEGLSLKEFFLLLSSTGLAYRR